MKRLMFMTVLGVGHVTTAAAEVESYEELRVDSGLTGTYVSASGRGGFGAMVEPKLYVHDNIAVGVRFEGAVMFGGEIGNDSTSIDLGAVGAFLAKGEYLLGTASVRPFVGLGLGIYDIASQSVTAGDMTAGVDQKAGRYFGIAPQLGIDLGRLRLAATYHTMIGADIVVHQRVGDVEETAEYSQNFLSFEMTIRFGGKRKRPAPTMMMPPPPPPGYAPPPPPPPPPGPPGETPRSS